MLSIRTQKSIAWFFFCGALSSMAFFVGVPIYEDIVLRSRIGISARGISRLIDYSYQMTYWPVSLFTIALVSFFRIRKLYRLEPGSNVDRLQLRLIDGVLITLTFSGVSALWVAKYKDMLFDDGIPIAAVTSLSLMSGLIFSNRANHANDTARILHGFAYAASFLGRVVYGGICLSILCTIPFSALCRTFNLQWSGMYTFSVESWGQMFFECFGVNSYSGWFAWTLILGILAAPLSLFFNWLARYSAGNAPSREI